MPGLRRKARNSATVPNNSTDRRWDLSLLALFEPAVFSTIAGLRLTVVAEFAAGAFGPRNRAEALRERYVGAILRWEDLPGVIPLANSQQRLEPELDDRQQPEQSLSGP